MGRSLEARIGRAVFRGGRKFVRWFSGELGDIVGMIRGEPGTAVTLKVLPANALAGAAPRVVQLVRGQLGFQQ